MQDGQDKSLQRLEVHRRLARLSPKEKLDALIDASNSKVLVRSMPAEELYYAILDVGLVDTTDIVQLASPTQFRTFVDLAAWTRDGMDPHQVLTWLRAARGDEPEDFLAKMNKLDLELVELMLRSFTVLHDLEEDPDVNPPGVTMESPEGKYLIEFTVDGVELAALRQILNDLFGQNAFEAGRLLEAIRWEVPTEMEEIAYRFRSARLEDLGFPPFEEALALFSWVDPDKVQGPVPAPALSGLAPAEGRVDYVGAVMRTLTELELENLDAEIRAVSNRALVAEAAEPGDLDAVRRVAEMVRDYINLGLEHLTRGDPSLAAEVVRDIPTKRVFQVGFSLTLRLKFRADRLAKEPLARIGEVWMTLSSEADALTALRRKRPLRALKIQGAEPVPFRSRRELEDAGRTLERAAAQVSLFRALLGNDVASAQQRLAAFGAPIELLGPDKVLAAAVAHAVLDGEARVEPLPDTRLPELLERLFEGTAQEPRFRGPAVDRARDALGQLVDPLNRPLAIAAVDSVLEHLRDELAATWLQEGTVAPSVGEVLPIRATATP
ncbi:MAG: DUF6178 family protein [Myxococcaceae bacterium]